MALRLTSQLDFLETNDGTPPGRLHLLAQDWCPAEVDSPPRGVSPRSHYLLGNNVGRWEVWLGRADPRSNNDRERSGAGLVGV